MKFLNVFLAAVTVISSMPTPQEGVFLEPVDREIMVVEKYNYNDFMSSFFSKENVYERETTPENTYEVPVPQTPMRGSEYYSRKRPNHWVPRSSNVRRRLFTNVGTEIPLPAPTPVPQRNNQDRGSANEGRSSDGRLEDPSTIFSDLMATPL